MKNQIRKPRFLLQIILLEEIYEKNIIFSFFVCRLCFTGGGI